jgi:hypothetical protein
MIIEQYAFVPANGGILAAAGTLPHVVKENGELQDLLAVLPAEARFLRVAAHVPLTPEHVVRLRVFEPLDEAGTHDVVVPAPLRDAFERCAAELAGAPVPRERPPWSRPGWHAQAEEWAGIPLEQVRVWPLSAVLRNGRTWFKATLLPLFAHEPAITAAVGMPPVIRSDRDRGWLLLDEVDGEVDHAASMRAIATVHRTWASRVDEALALGAPDRRAASALPHTLVHGDFHRWNVVGDAIIDWSDAAVANPLHDVNHYLLNVEDELREPLLRVYGDAYGADVRAAADACEAETYEYVATSYAQITAALAPDDRWWFAGEAAKWLQRASDVRAGRRPSRDT